MLENDFYNKGSVLYHMLIKVFEKEEVDQLMDKVFNGLGQVSITRLVLDGERCAERIYEEMIKKWGKNVADKIYSRLP